MVGRRNKSGRRHLDGGMLHKIEASKDTGVPMILLSMTLTRLLATLYNCANERYQSILIIRRKP
jgi:hypothetical protein